MGVRTKIAVSHQLSASNCYLQKLCLLFLFLSDLNRKVNCQSGECKGVNLNVIACLPGPENVARGRRITISPNVSTCGSPPSGYCRPKPRNGCFTCNSSNPSQTHVPANMFNDNDPPSGFWDAGIKPKWWQSITWWDARQRGLLIDNTLKVNVTFSFNKTFDITGAMKVTFYSAKPKAVIIERSVDFGKSWTAYSYFADNCATRFATPIPTRITAKTVNNFLAYCEESRSTIAQQGAQISFNPVAAFQSSNFWDPKVQRYVTATDIRIRLEYPWTDGNHVIPQEEFLNQYYYDITDVYINGRCHCNGHGKSCQGRLDQLTCVCYHNTEGVDCERCKPLYNNRTWMAASSLTQTNPCEKCQCNDHAVSCVFNSTLGFGVCTDCNHNTTGYLCDQCQDRFYRNLSNPINSQRACTSCDCYSFGIRNNGSCAQVATSNGTIGQCDCKNNFRGRRCDLCQDGHYGLTISPIGQCKACNCSSIGSVNSSITCHQITGQCNCKNYINGITCDVCRDGYHTFPNDTNGDCQACLCNNGGAYSNVCNKTAGDCFCRQGIVGRSCDAPADGYFTPAFDHLTKEVEQPSDAISSINGSGRSYTGFGFARLTVPGQVTAFFQPTFASRYSLVIRYKQNRNESAQLKSVFHYHNYSVSVLVSSLNLTLPASTGSASSSYRYHEAIELLADGNYSVTLSFANSSAANQAIDIDSIVLLWDFTQSRHYRNANGTIRNTTRACWEARQSILTTNGESSVCKRIAFSVNSELFNGSLACGCNPVGTLNNTYCDKYGGQCQCKPGIGGRRCDQCLPGFYNFTSEGCAACKCTELGSRNLVCDVVTGQCPCKPGVVNRTCSGCRPSFFGYQTGFGCRNCSCNWDGSAIVFCDENGVCPCKNTTTGAKCDKCKPLHFNFTSHGCAPCNCDPMGSTDLQCDLQSGNCSCKRDTQGLKCDSCKSGHYALQTTNTNGCQRCFCFNKTDQCAGARGFYALNIQSQFINQTDQWQMVNSSGLAITYYNTSSGLRFDAKDNNPIIMRAARKYLGNKLSSYAQTLTIRFSSVATLVNSSAQLILVITHQDGSRVSFLLPANTTLRQHSIVFRLQELYVVGETSAYRLQHVLTSIASMTIQINTSGVTSVSVQSINMASTSNSIVSSAVVNYVENCSCPVNFTGISCESCARGYTREFPNNGSYTNCKLCECNSRSITCNPQNGICSNCRTGTKGKHCERCEQGVQEPNCTTCIPGYYGLNDTSFEGCRSCNCVLLNTIGYNNTVCNAASGQCNCRENIGGIRCDRCAENAVNITGRGCQTCPECYRLIQVEVQALRRSILNVTTSLNSVEKLVNLSKSRSFGSRLSTLSDSVARLTANARNSSSIERGLATELAALNFSLDAMQRILERNVSGSVNSTNDNISVINGTRSQVVRLQKELYQLLWASHHILHRDVNGKVNTTGELKTALDTRNANMSSLWSQYSTQYRQTGGLLNQTLTSSANAVSSAASMVSLHNETSHILNSSRNLLRQHRITLETLQASVSAIQSNLSAILNNATRLSSTANEAIENATSLNTTPDQRFAQLRASFNNLQTNLSSLNSTMTSLRNSHNILSRNLTSLKTRSAALERNLNQTEEELKSLAIQAGNAGAVATNAVNSASSVLKEAESMLRIMRNFNATARNAESMASVSLQRTNEVNATSLRAIAYTDSIKQDLNIALAAATKSLSTAENASYVAGNLSVTLEALLNGSKGLRFEASASPYTDSYFNNIRRNVTSTAANVAQPRASECRNYTSQGRLSQRSATQSFAAAANLSNEVKAKQADVETVVHSFQELSRLNATSLRQLQQKLVANLQRFTASNVKTMVSSLRADYASQKTALQAYRSTITRLRSEIAGVKRTVNEISFLQGCT